MPQKIQLVYEHPKNFAIIWRKYFRETDWEQQNINSLIKYNEDTKILICPWDEDTNYNHYWYTHCDIPLFRWINKNAFPYERYIILEADCYVNTNLKEYCKPFWYADLAGACVNIPAHPVVNWSIPNYLLQYSSNILFACTFWSKKCIEKIASDIIEKKDLNEMFCETRFTTLAMSLKFTLVEFPQKYKETITSGQYIPKIHGPNVYHPIKFMI